MKQTNHPTLHWQPFLLILTLCLASLTTWAQRQYSMDYQVDFDTLGHYLIVTLDYNETSPTAASDIVLNMPVWAPGYYEILDFPTHLCDFAAQTNDGQKLA